MLTSLVAGLALGLIACQSDAPGAPTPRVEPSGGDGAAQPIALSELVRRAANDRARAVGKRFRVEGKVKSISMSAMSKDLQGAAAEGVPGALYAVPLVDDGAQTVCWLERAQQQELLREFNHAGSLKVTVEGTVEPTFGQLAPCKVAERQQP